MDIFSHTLWGYGLFGFRGRPWLALLFGAMPDFLSFGILTIIRYFNGGPMGKPALESIPPWVFSVYDVTHSMVIAVFAILIVWRFRKDIAFTMLAWPFHLLLDIPFHSKAFFPTPFLWPLSDYTFDGVPWSMPWVWFPNVAGIFILLVWRFKQRGTGTIRRVGESAPVNE